MYTCLSYRGERALVGVGFLHHVGSEHRSQFVRSSEGLYPLTRLGGPQKCLTSLSLCLPGFSWQVDKPAPSRMTSATPPKKPYRKAPPEHRELRLEIPVSQLQQEVSKTGIWSWLPEASP